MAGIPWFTGAPEAYAKTQKQLRQLGALRGLTDIGGNIMGNVRDLGNQEDADNAAMEQLRARLGIQQQQVSDSAESIPDRAAQGKPLTTSNLDTGAVEGASVTPWTGTAPAGSPEAVTEPPAEYGLPTWQDVGEGAKTVGRGALGVLGTLGIASGLLPNRPHGQRGMELARLRGRVLRQQDERQRAAALGGLIRGAQDPGALLGKVAPTMGLHAGDVTMAPGRLTGTDAYLWQTVQKLYPTDPQKQIDAVVKAKAKMRGPGAHGGNPNIYAIIEARQSPDPETRARADRMWDDVMAIEKRRHPPAFGTPEWEAQMGGDEGGVRDQGGAAGDRAGRTSHQGHADKEGGDADLWGGTGEPGGSLPGGGRVPRRRPNPRIIEGVPITE